MDPDQQPGSQQSSSQYDFILNSKKPAKKSFIGGNGSKKRRIIIVAVGALLLLTIALVVITFLSNAGKQSYDDSMRIIKIQRELIQASSEALAASPNADTRSYAATITTTLTSDTQQLEAYLLKNGQKKPLGEVAKKNTTIDETLSKAASSNNFDAAYKDLTDGLLQKYITELKTSNAESKSKTEKALLEASFQHVRTLTQTATE